MKRRSIFLKMLVGFVVLNAIFILFMSFVANRIIKDSYLRTIGTNLTNSLNIVKLETTNLFTQNRLGELQEYVNQVGNNTNYRVTLIIPSGEVIADSEKEYDLLDSHRDRPEFISAMQRQKGEAVRFSSSVNKSMLYQAIPLTVDNQVMAVLRLSLFLDDIDSLIRTLQLEIFVIGLITMIIAFLVIYLFARRLTRPISELTTAASRMSSGDFDVKVSIYKDDDIGYLCRSFNDMSSRIKQLISELTDQKDELDTIIESMKEGLLLFDEEGKIVHYNQSLRKILNNDVSIGKHYWEVIKQPELAEYIREVNVSKQELKKEVKLSNRFYQCNTTLLKNRNQILLLIYDIDEHKKTEKIKQEIIANVSHELRSPLTAIKGFIETIEGEVSQEGRKYLEIISRNVERLINIVSDLLTLSKLEQIRKLQTQKININDVIKRVAQIYEEKAKSKGLILKLDLNDQIPEIEADEFKIEQVLINLIENALQHTPNGSISVGTAVENRLLNIEVTDTGIGVSAEHLDRIFERFYVVDQSRSKKNAGTGLGLSIVKHITLLHNGMIDLKSQPGKGSTFIVKLPI